jgi:hypothetical protein
MLSSIFIWVVVLVLKVTSLNEFLLEESFLLELACNDHTIISTLSSSEGAQICGQKMGSNKALLCSKLQLEGYSGLYTLKLYRSGSESVGE